VQRQASGTSLVLFQRVPVVRMKAAVALEAQISESSVGHPG